MPYTPPAQRSPAASQSSTPPRAPSNHTATGSQFQDPSSHGPRPNHSRSSSQTYLHKHRRSPSVSKPTATLAESTTPEMSAVNGRSSDVGGGTDVSSSLSASRQIGKPMTNGTTIGGTDSPPPFSDEEGSGRGWSSDAKSLAELQAAIRGIGMNRQGSPVPDEERMDAEPATSTEKHLRLDPPADIKVSDSVLPHTPPLTAGARKISHSRSTTDASAFFDFPKHKLDSPARSGSDDDLDEDELEIKPSLIRKKSGELVRPALRPASRRRPSSMPGTPTYSKNVHFQETSLEHVRHFLQVDRPIAVSAGSSPVSKHEEEPEYPFGAPGSGTKSPTNEWEINLPNFPPDTVDRRARLVRTEKVCLSPDRQNLLGNVIVWNLAFHKLVVMRFTLDYWKTTSEVKAEYNKDIRQTQTNDGYDLFTFEIKLEDLANLENRTMFFCVKYAVNGLEYWDNNNSTNYQVDFSKATKSQNAKQGLEPEANRSLNGPPRSKPAQPRPRSMPSFDDFGNYTAPFDFSSFPQPNSMVGESSIRFKNRPTAKEIVPDAPPKPKNTGIQQAFGSRYDFGASLSAAIQSGTNTGTKGSLQQDGAPTLKAPSSVPKRTGEKKERARDDVPKPTALVAGKPSLQSSSYNELINKYCFFGSCKSSPAQPQPSNDVGEKSNSERVAQTSGTSSPYSEASSTSKKATGSASPSSPRSSSPTAEQKPSVASIKYSSPRPSRSASPATGGTLGSRSHSPGFGYPYHHGIQSNFLETHAPTAIPG